MQQSRTSSLSKLIKAPDAIFVIGHRCALNRDGEFNRADLLVVRIVLSRKHKKSGAPREETKATSGRLLSNAGVATS
jgi:hypothetical protein